MTYAIILAAGSARRMGLEKNKTLLSLNEKPVVCYSIEAFSPLVEGIVVVYKQGEEETLRQLFMKKGFTQAVSLMVQGGQTRQQSVQNALYALPDAVTKVLIHDGARPFVTPTLIKRVKAALTDHPAVIPALALTDTIKRVDKQGRVIETLPREELAAVQTPQGFDKALLLKAYKQAEEKATMVTDHCVVTGEAAVMERMGEEVITVAGDEENRKLTTFKDWQWAQQQEEEKNAMMYVGQGYDVHRLIKGRRLILCGVDIPYEKGLLGHSDADVATHALIDALLGAAGLGDIGTLFPDTSQENKGISSIYLLQKVVEILHQQNYTIGNVDVTIVAQAPKLQPYMLKMKENLAEAMQISPARVNVKATTTEKLGFEGEGLGISAQSVCLLHKKE